ncbi:MAG: hypothetical protein P9M00_06175 [Candidatus Tritonobacter lacicola]|nr:hypothetical protein [Candidatus Tritonobacter lacicola]
MHRDLPDEKYESRTGKAHDCAGYQDMALEKAAFRHMEPLWR